MKRLFAFVSMCVFKAVHMYIKQDCFYSLMDKMVLLQIVAFIEIYGHSRMDTHTDSWRDCWVCKEAWGWTWGREGKDIGAKGNLWVARYKQVNDSLFFLRLFLHLSAWPVLWETDWNFRSLLNSPGRLSGTDIQFVFCCSLRALMAAVRHWPSCLDAQPYSLVWITLALGLL